MFAKQVSLKSRFNIRRYLSEPYSDLTDSRCVSDGIPPARQPAVAGLVVVKCHLTFMCSQCHATARCSIRWTQSSTMGPAYGKTRLGKPRPTVMRPVFHLCAALRFASNVTLPLSAAVRGGQHSGVLAVILQTCCLFANRQELTSLCIADCRHPAMPGRSISAGAVRWPREAVHCWPMCEKHMASNRCTSASGQQKIHQVQGEQ